MRTLIISVLLAMLVLAILLAGGCADKQSAESGSTDGSEQLSQAQPAQEVDADVSEISVDEDATGDLTDADKALPGGNKDENRAERMAVLYDKLGVTEEDVVGVEQLLISEIASSELTYNEETTTISLKDSAEPSDSLERMAVNVLMQCKQEGEDLSPEALQAAVSSMVKSCEESFINFIASQEQEQVERDAREAQDKLIAQQKPETLPIPTGFSAAASIKGEWRSVREEQLNSDAVINHDLDYCDVYAFTADDNVRLTIIRYGETIKELRYAYTYDATTGMLQLQTPEGRPAGTYLVLTKGNSHEISLLQAKGTTLKVCMNTGSI